jgi:hypothetical protein
MTRRAGAFYGLPRCLQKWLIRHCPGWRISVPTHRYIPEVEILAAVLNEMDSTGLSQWRACFLVAGRVDRKQDTVWKIVQRRRSQARCEPPMMSPEYEGRRGPDRSR